jgi:5-methyltetrahydropteroyltriglutamate--homocysteine methyltransferase
MPNPESLTIPTEPIGSIPRPADLIERIAKADSDDPTLDRLYENAIRETMEQLEATGSPVITDGEQKKYHNFCTYCVYRFRTRSSLEPDKSWRWCQGDG